MHTNPLLTAEGSFYVRGWLLSGYVKMIKNPPMTELKTAIGGFSIVLSIFGLFYWLSGIFSDNVSKSSSVLSLAFSIKKLIVLLASILNLGISVSSC